MPLCPGLRLNSCPVQGTLGCQWSHQVLIQGVEDKGDRRCQLGTNAFKEAEEPFDQTPFPYTHIYREY